MMSVRASRPLPVPTVCAAPQYAENLASNSFTRAPSIYHPASITSASAARSSARCAALIVLRSRNGFLIPPIFTWFGLLLNDPKLGKGKHKLGFEPLPAPLLHDIVAIVPGKDDDIVRLFFEDDVVRYDRNMRARQIFTDFLGFRKLRDIGQKIVVEPVIIDEHGTPPGARIGNEPLSPPLRLVGKRHEPFAVTLQALPPLRPGFGFEKPALFFLFEHLADTRGRWP